MLGSEGGASLIAVAVTTILKPEAIDQEVDAASPLWSTVLAHKAHSPGTTQACRRVSFHYRKTYKQEKDDGCCPVRKKQFAWSSDLPWTGF